MELIFPDGSKEAVKVNISGTGNSICNFCYHMIDGLLEFHRGRCKNLYIARIMKDKYSGVYNQEVKVFNEEGGVAEIAEIAKTLKEIKNGGD